MSSISNPDEGTGGRIEHFSQRITVHYRGHDAGEQQSYKDVEVWYMSDGWTQVRRRHVVFTVFPPGGVIRIEAERA